MDVFSFISLVGGIAFFLYGMRLMGSGLEKIAGGRLESIIEKMTDKTIKAVVLGAGVTAIIQSSSATTVMVVGFVNSGIMKLSQAAGIIMGANIGTTATSWILSLTGIESSNLFVRLLKPESFAPIFAVIGIIFIMFLKSKRHSDIGLILIGFGILMSGMSTMSAAVKPLANVPEFTGILTAFSNPVLGLLAGAILTAIIQSSSASVGILQALSLTGGVTFLTAVPIILGQNIGTCVTAVISGIGAGKNAKRAVMIHLYFNIIGSMLFLSLFYLLNSFFRFSFINEPVDALSIAFVHTLFNLFTTVVLLPSKKLLCKLASLSIRDNESFQEYDTPDERLLLTPAFALEQCKSSLKNMVSLVSDNLKIALASVSDYSDALFERMNENENTIDRYEDKLGAYLVKLSGKDLTASDNTTVSKMLFVISDLERIADHSMNILEGAQQLKSLSLSYSQKALNDINVLSSAIDAVVSDTMEAYSLDDIDKAYSVEPLEQVIDALVTDARTRHVNRLRKGICYAECAAAFTDLLTNLERISDHCSNIALSIIQCTDESIEAHSYLSNMISSNYKEFKIKFNTFRQKYKLHE